MKRLLRSLPLLAGIAVLGLLAWGFGLHGLAQAFESLSPLRLLLYLAFTAAVVFGYAWRWQIVARTLGANVPLTRLASARLAGDAIGTLVPSARLAGEPVRAGIISAGGVEGTAATAGVALDRVLETVSNILCALVYVSVFSLAHGGRSSVAALATGLVAGLAALAIPLVLLRRGLRPLWPVYALLGARQPPWLGAVRRTEDHLVRTFRHRPGTLLWGLLLSLATEGLVVCQYHFLLSAFGIGVDLPTLLLVLVGTGMARAVPTPASLGTLESGQVAVFTLAEAAPALGFVAGMVIRMHETLLLVAGFVALSAHGMTLARLRVARSGEASA
jgi:uncharacterized membrane protein YbhN (UPF0104 family)